MIFKIIFRVLVVFFLLLNMIAYNHAYHFTHFSQQDIARTKRAEELSLIDKLKTLVLGIQIPKPKNELTPTLPYQTVQLKSDENLEAWHINPITSYHKGTVIMFHGYASCKSGLLPYAMEFNRKGYSVFLVDFMGSGGSSGHTTTIGFKESRDVKAAYDYIKQMNPQMPITLFGSSMGAVAIMKAIADDDLKPAQIILECPFGSMLATTKIRFEAMNVPSFPFAHLLLGYGWIQLGFNPYAHRPTEYAKQIEVPTLLLYGAKDKRVTRAEIEEIYANLNGEKRLTIFDNSEHEIYLNDDRSKWNTVVDQFLNRSQ